MRFHFLSTAIVVTFLSLPHMTNNFAASANEVNETQIDQVMQSEKFVAMIRGFDLYFPEHADRIRTEFRKIISKRKDPKTAFSMMSILNRQFVEAKAHHLLAAPDKDLIAVLNSDAKIILRIAHNPALCSQFARSGPEGISLQQSQLLKLHEFDIEILLRAIHSGITNPVNRAVATESDYAALYQETLRAGGSIEGWRGFSEADADPSATCETAISLYQVLTAGKFKNASAVLAEFVSSSRSAP